MAQDLMDELAKRGLTNPPNVDDAVVSFGQAGDIYEGWLRTVPIEHRPSIALLLAGYRRLDSATPMPMIYLLISNFRFSPQLAGAYPMMVGVPQYAVYLSHRYYDPNASSDQAAGLAEYLISETASQDPKVGGPIQIAKVFPDNGYKALTDDEVSTLRKRYQKLNDRLRGFFKSGGR